MKIIDRPDWRKYVYVRQNEPVRHLSPVPKANLINYEHVKKLKVCSLNRRSVKNKTLDLSDLVVSNDFDVVALTETWLGTVSDKVCLSELVPTGYDIVHVPRANRTGGAVAVLYRTEKSVKILASSKDGMFSNFE